MAKKKNRDLVEEQGIGYIKVTAKVKKGADFIIWEQGAAEYWAEQIK